MSEETPETPRFTRRRFLKWGAAGGALVVGFAVPWRKAADMLVPASREDVLRGWLEIGKTGEAVIRVGQSEMGQGVFTSLPMLIAEELDFPFERIRVLPSPTGKAWRHRGGLRQMTGNSLSVRRQFTNLRQVGAAAREMLKSAAAARWKVPADRLVTEAGLVRDPISGKQESYGALAAAASRLPIPADPPLRSPGDWKLLGTSPPRTDTPDKVRGTAEYTGDIRLPGLLYAAVQHAPTLGATARSAPRPPELPEEVQGPFPVPGGVALVAPDSWRALRAAERLEIEWADGPGRSFSSEEYAARLGEAAARPGDEVLSEGDVEAALAGAAKRLEAVYEVPFLAHATMEPQVCTAWFRGGRLEVWAPTQAQESARDRAAEVTGLDPSAVTLHTTLLGGGFGRRFETDFVAQAASLAKRLGVPVQVLWSREEDLKNDFYRPAFACRIEAGLGPDGKPTAWRARIAGSSILKRVFPLALWKGPDPTTTEGLDIPYRVPARQVEAHQVDSPVPVGFWRSVGGSQNGFFVESFVDELALAAGADPIEYRLGLLPREGRHARVLTRLRQELAGDAPAPSGRGRGVAVHESFGTVIAHMAEASIEGGTVRVHRVLTVVDCGRVVYPDGARAQVESSVAYALSAALHGEVPVENGAVRLSNFHDYRLVTMGTMPRVEVVLAPGGGPLGGMGEPAVPPLAPAVANAVVRAGGPRLRRLPFRLD